MSRNDRHVFFGPFFYWPVSGATYEDVQKLTLHVSEAGYEKIMIPSRLCSCRVYCLSERLSLHCYAGVDQ